MNDYTEIIQESSIIPFCIYHYTDPDTGTYLGFIGMPQITRTKSGKITYKCITEPKTFRGWKNTGVFYAITPMIRPIPFGMYMFCAQKANGFPYDTSDMYNVMDSYNIKNNCVYFITYSRPVPNTVPLYMHKIGTTVFPSFDPKPPSNDEWTTTDVSPLYVMTPGIFGNDLGKIKFRCINGTCLPWKNDIPDIYDDTSTTPSNLDECLLKCNNSEPKNLIQRLALQDKKQGTLLFLPNIIMILCIIFCVIVVIGLTKV